MHSGWRRELVRLFLLYAFAALAGWLAGHMLLFIAVVTTWILASWLYQLRRVERWLERPDSEPPEATGIWGDIFDGIYHLQRVDREERGRLQTAVSYLRDSLAALDNAAVIIDPQGSIEWTNDAAKRMLGLEYPRDRGQAILNLLRIPSFHSYFSQTDHNEALLMDSPRRAGMRLMIEITQFGAGSRLLFARDVTREQRLEGMRRDFVANVSHELRTPLTVINGYLLTLLDMQIAGDPALQRPLAQMQQQAQRMETLVRDLLWLSRLESLDNQGQDFTEVDVTQLIQELVQDALTAFPQRKVVIAAQSNELLRGNYQQLHSAFSNLLTNALKYSDGDVELDWSSTQRGLVFSVTDQGQGIDSVHLPRLPERFYRVDPSRSQETGGTGLGLAIVKHVLVAHGSHLEIESDIVVGSCFRCIFALS